jgi:hypothetical protein
LALTITVSGLAYLTIWNALGWTACISGSLLLLSVSGMGVRLTVRLRRQGRA